MIILYVNMLIYLFIFVLLNIKCEKKIGYNFFFFMYLINYFIYLYNFKAIYDVTGSTTGPTPVGPVVREPLPFPVLFPVRFLKPWSAQIHYSILEVLWRLLAIHHQMLRKHIYT